MSPDEIVSRVLYRDALMLVIDKPAGMPVHAGPRSATMSGPVLERLFPHLAFGLPRPPALAHRLDRDTSGCLILGRHRKALADLTDLFKAGRIDKAYWAVVDGAPDADEGLIDLPLGRKDATRGWWMKVDPDGLPAQTRWRVLGRAGEKTSLELVPITGRTHQLRVHCAAMGWPITGDPVYGTGDRFGPVSLHLHAQRVVVPLYKNKPAIDVSAPPPPHMAAALGECGLPPAGMDFATPGNRSRFGPDLEQQG